MEFAVLAARIDCGRHARNEFRIEYRPCPFARRPLQVHAGDDGSQAGGGHFFGEGARPKTPERKKQLQAARCELLLAVAADVLEKQVAESEMRDPFASLRPEELGRSE